MAYQLDFALRQEYDSRSEGITIEAGLSLGALKAVIQAKLDPGAELCLFQRELGERLGLVVETGYRLRIGTLAGTLTAYGHTVTLTTLGLEFESLVYFAADYGLQRNLLGRSGWLQKVRLAIVDYEATLYLSPYENGEEK